MGDGPDTPYTPKDHRNAIIASSLLGWLGVTMTDLIATSGRSFSYLPLSLIIGLPLAFLSTWLVGGPIIRRIMSRPVTWPRAAFGGAIVAAVLAAISILIGRLNGLRIAYDDSFNFQLGYGDYLREVDGILTPYGWLLLGQNTAIFVAVGAVVGVMARKVIGPGRNTN